MEIGQNTTMILICLIASFTSIICAYIVTRD